MSGREKGDNINSSSSSDSSSSYRVDTLRKMEMDILREMEKDISIEMNILHEMEMDIKIVAFIGCFKYRSENGWIVLVDGAPEVFLVLVCCWQCRVSVQV